MNDSKLDKIDMPDKYNISYLKSYIINKYDMKMNIAELGILVDNGMYGWRTTTDDEILNNTCLASVYDRRQMYRYIGISPLTCRPCPGG